MRFSRGGRASRAARSPGRARFPGGLRARAGTRTAARTAWAPAARRPSCRRRALRRVRETPPQVGRDRAARARNVQGAFAASTAVAGRDVVLVDDVVTTGATADACARALKAAGARSVTVVSLARAE